MTNLEESPLPSKVMTFSQDTLIAKAKLLGDEILAGAKRASDGSPAWVAMRPTGTPGENNLVPIGPHLYGGSCGIALFLAGLAKVTGEERYAAGAESVLEPLRRRFVDLLNDSERADRLNLGLGAYFGLSSLIYTFHTAGRLQSRPEWCEHAAAMTDLATEKRIAADTWYDLTFGGAGFILVLLRMRDATNDAARRGRFLSLALTSARHLADARKSHEGLPPAWYTTPDAPPMTGYSHGAAGIVYALSSLNQCQPEPWLEAAIRDGLEFERSQYRPDLHNWRDMRYEDSVYGETWCHGAPGIGLGRAAMVGHFQDEGLENEAEIGLAGAISLGRRGIDHVCCGNLGRAEILLSAAQLLQRDELLQEGRKVVLQVIDRAERIGVYRWLPKAEGDHFDPAFFNGAAGAGYCFLRYATEPGTLPSVFLLE